MKRSVLLAWVLFFGYALSSAALQGLLASPWYLGSWAPDLGLVLLFSWSARMAPERAPFAALLAALARSSLSADPLIVLAAGSLGAVGILLVLRRGLEVDHGLVRAVVCGLCASLTSTLAITARSTVLAAGPSELSIGATVLWPGALSSAIASLTLAPFALRLPGLKRLRRVQR